MNDEIHVSVTSAGPGRALALYWRDPLNGKRRVVSAKTKNEKEAERAAAVLQDELNTGRYAAPSRITWQEFRRRYRGEKLAAMPNSSQVAYNVALDHLERVIGPDRLAKMTARVMSAFQANAREEGMRSTTIGRHLRHIKAALRWAERQGMLAKAPAIEMPKLPKGQSLMKSRPITAEEFDRLVEAAPKVRKQDGAAWVRLLRGLWLSGMWLSEALALDWEEGPVILHTAGPRLVLRIESEGQKSRRAEVAPLTPDFAEFVLLTPDAERHGPVFKLNSLSTGGPVTAQRAGQIVSRIGRRAGVSGRHDGKDGPRRRQTGEEDRQAVRGGTDPPAELLHAMEQAGDAGRLDEACPTRPYQHDDGPLRGQHGGKDRRRLAGRPEGKTEKKPATYGNAHNKAPETSTGADTANHL